MRTESTEYSQELGIDIEYNQVKVKARDDGFGELHMSLDKVGSINIRVPYDNRDLRYCATRGHL